MEGVVKFFSRGEHFGFIQLVDESGELVYAEYFFSGNDVIGDVPKRGDTVSFLIEDPPSRAHRRSLIAVEVERVANFEIVEAFDDFEKRLADEAVCA